MHDCCAGYKYRKPCVRVGLSSEENRKKRWDVHEAVLCLYIRACMMLHSCLYTRFMSQFLEEVWKRIICDSAGIKQIIWQSVTFEKVVAQDNGFDAPKANAIANLNFEHCRETIRLLSGNMLWNYDSAFAHLTQGLTGNIPLGTAIMIWSDCVCTDMHRTLSDNAMQSSHSPLQRLAEKRCLEGLRARERSSMHEQMLNYMLVAFNIQTAATYTLDRAIRSDQRLWAGRAKQQARAIGNNPRQER